MTSFLHVPSKRLGPGSVKHVNMPLDIFLFLPIIYFINSLLPLAKLIILQINDKAVCRTVLASGYIGSVKYYKQGNFWGFKKTTIKTLFGWSPGKQLYYKAGWTLA